MMRTRTTGLLLAAALAAVLPCAAALAQADSPATDLKGDPAHPGQAISKSADGAGPASADTISPAPKPSQGDLATRNVVPLPSSGGAGVAPPAMPGAPNPSPPGSGSKP